MKVMLVNGSPHKEGCTYAALTEVAKTLNEESIDTEIFWIGSKPISGCIACRACRTTGRCAIDDVVNEFRDIAHDADGYIFGTPVHYAAAAGNMTSFMDRLFYSDHGADQSLFYLKPAACVIVARRAGTTATYDQMNKYFGLNQMPIISARYWNMVHGAKPEDVYKDEEGLYNMRVLARNMAFFLKCKQVALQHGVEFPKQEPPVFTNFIR